MRKLRAWFFVILLLGPSTSPGRCETIYKLKSGTSRDALMQVYVRGVVTYLDTGECHVEATDRSGGICVEGDTTGISLGDSVEARGTYSTTGVEPSLVSATITPQTGTTVIRPFAMNNKAIGGVPPPPYPCVWDYGKSDETWSWMRTCGANNTGLLVTTWGTVKAAYQSGAMGLRWFYVDDGSGMVSDFGDTGVLVYCTADVNEGDFVRVTGVSGVEPSLDDPSRLIRVVRTRTPDDVQVQKVKTLLTTPFSDEFDGTKLDPRWAIAVNAQTGGSFSARERLAHPLR